MRSDPMGLAAGINTYVYSLNTPVSNYDPLGLSPLGDAFGMSIDWLFGLGDGYRQFNDFSDQVQDLKQRPAVDDARKLFYDKNRGRLASGCCEGLEPVTSYRSPFGVKGYFNAWWELDATSHFVGSFAIDIIPSNDCKTITFVLTNNSSFKSFLYGIGPDWERSKFHPMGNMRQTYTWTEPVR